MEATTWKSSDSYGIRVRKDDAMRYFRKEWTDVKVKMGEKYYTFKLSETFWERCPEIRGEPIKKWLQQRGIYRWDNNQTYFLELVPIGYKKFELLEPAGKTKKEKINIVLDE
jgi:hypothetical protein